MFYIDINRHWKIKVFDSLPISWYKVYDNIKYDKAIYCKNILLAYQTHYFKPRVFTFSSFVFCINAAYDLKHSFLGWSCATTYTLITLKKKKKSRSVFACDKFVSLFIPFLAILFLSFFSRCRKSDVRSPIYWQHMSAKTQTMLNKTLLIWAW